MKCNNPFTDILNYFIVQQVIETKEWILVSAMRHYQDAFDYVNMIENGNMSYFKLKYVIIYYDYLKNEYIILEKKK